MCDSSTREFVEIFVAADDERFACTAQSQGFCKIGANVFASDSEDSTFDQTRIVDRVGEWAE